MPKHFEKPTLKAPTLDAVAEYALEVAAYNRAACSAIDSAMIRRGVNGSGANRADKLTGSQCSARDKKTVHDIMANNPEMLAAYRELMRGAS